MKGQAKLDGQAMNKVAQIIPYFGKWPEWMELYLYSCSRNPMVDFIFYTDCPLQPAWQRYGNVRFVETSFRDYCRHVGEQLGIAYNISSPYKLTDLKPFLGKVHEQDLRGYAFWGFGDLDLVYGDLSILVNDANLARYEVITTHNYHIAGHFTLCRNNSYYRDLCLNIRDWQTRLADDTHHGFDEAEWSHLLYPALRYVRRLYDFLKPLGVSFHAYMERTNRLLSPRRLFSEYHTTPTPQPGQVWTYSPQANRVCSPQGRELPYLHFLFFKKTPWYEAEHYWSGEYYHLGADIGQHETISINLNGIHPLK